MSLEMPRATWVSPGFSRSKPLFPDDLPSYHDLKHCLLKLPIAIQCQWHLIDSLLVLWQPHSPLSAPLAHAQHPTIVMVCLLVQLSFLRNPAANLHENDPVEKKFFEEEEGDKAYHRRSGFFGNSTVRHRDRCSRIAKIVCMSMYIYPVFPDPVQISRGDLFLQVWRKFHPVNSHVDRMGVSPEEFSSKGTSPLPNWRRISRFQT